MSDNNRINRIKNEIRTNVIKGAKVYKENLVGKYFLYIFDDKFFIINYQIGSFMHLAGLKYTEGAENFYEKCTSPTPSIQVSNFIFSQKNPLLTARKKCKHLTELPEFITNELLVLTDVVTEKENKPYPYVITTLDKSICLGLYEMEDNIFYPKSLRIKGNITDKKHSGIYSIDFILSKTDKEARFSNVHYIEKGKEYPSSLNHLLIDNLLNNEQE